MKNLRKIGCYFLIVSAVMAVLSSCIYDDLTEPQPGIIIMSLNGVQTRGVGDPLFIEDEIITKVRVLVFVNEVLEKNTLFTSGETTFSNPFVIDVSTGIKDVFVVANESAALSSYLVDVKSKILLKEILADNIIAPLELPLVMTGEATNVAVMDNTNSIASVTLKRAVAKISLIFKKNTVDQVEIKKVSLISNTSKTTLWENGSTILNQTYWDYTKEFVSPFVLADNNTKLEMDPLYVYENLGGSPENKTTATRIEVEALYNNIPTIYRAYINENVLELINSGDPVTSTTLPSDHLYTIKRNHEYRLTGTIINIGEFDGLTLTTNVLPWNYLSSEILFERVFTINPHPSPVNRTYTVSNPSNEISFTFKLTNPIDATWTANLTNTVDFEFNSAFQGVTNDEISIKVKPKNVQGSSPRETEFYINVQYGGNWEEIPILNGSALVGAGNRVIINQPAINP